jgi:hypothetical protein
VPELFAPFLNKGVGNAGRAMHPQPRVEMIKPHELVTTGPPGHPGIPAREWF